MTRAAIKHGEDRLRQASLAGDVRELDMLLSDRALFCDPNGVVSDREHTLAEHHSGALKISRYEPSELVIELHETVAIVSVRAEMAGEVRGQPFSGAFRYTRTWALEDGVWRVVGAHAGAIAPSGRSPASPALNAH